MSAVVYVSSSAGGCYSVTAKRIYKQENKERERERKVTEDYRVSKMLQKERKQSEK
jgi:hypothetical protein